MEFFNNIIKGLEVILVLYFSLTLNVPLNQDGKTLTTYTIKIRIVPVGADSDYNIYAEGSISIDSSITINSQVIGSLMTDSFSLTILTGDSTSLPHLFEFSKFGRLLEYQTLSYNYSGGFDISISE